MRDPRIDVTQVDNDRCTPFNWAAMGGHIAVKKKEKELTNNFMRPPLLVPYSTSLAQYLT